MRPRVFIISSRQAIDVARSVQDDLEKDVADVTVWDQPDLFEVAGNAIDSLLAALDGCNHAVAILSADDKIARRGVALDAPRDNVVFELGLAIARLGKERCFFLVADADDEGSIARPSDLDGLTFARYSATRAASDPDGALATACNKLRAAIRNGTTRPPEVRFKKNLYRFLGDVWRNSDVNFYHNVHLSEYTRYCRFLAQSAERLFTMLTIDPRTIVRDICGGVDPTNTMDEKAFMRHADRDMYHYKAYRQHGDCTRLVIMDGPDWLDRNKPALRYLSLLNGDIPCYVLDISEISQHERRLMMVDHTVADQHVCMYDQYARTLTYASADKRTWEYFGYKDIGRWLRDNCFQTLGGFMNSIS